MQQITKFFLCAGLGAVLSDGALDKVREKIDTEAIWHALADQVERMEEADDVAELVVEALTDAFPEFVRRTASEIG